MATNARTRAADNGSTDERQPAALAFPAYGLWAEGLRASYAAQNAVWRLGLDTIERGQRSWWDQWQRMAEVGQATLFPVTERQLNARFEAAERRAAERQDRIRADFERATAELRETQREASQAAAQAVRDAGREQRAARAALDESVDKLSARLDRLTKAQGEQLDKLNTALTEHEQRLRERLGDRIRSAVGAVEAAKPSDVEELRRQVAALSEAVTTTRDELTSFTREWREQRVASDRPSPAARPSAPGKPTRPAAPGNE